MHALFSLFELWGTTLCYIYQKNQVRWKHLCIQQFQFHSSYIGKPNSFQDENGKSRPCMELHRHIAVQNPAHPVDQNETQFVRINSKICESNNTKGKLKRQRISLWQLELSKKLLFTIVYKCVTFTVLWRRMGLQQFLPYIFSTQVFHLL